MNLKSIKYFIFLSIICASIFAFKNKVDLKPQFTTLLKTSESWNGDQLPNYPVGKPVITVLKAVIPPKTKLDVHKHGVINTAVVLKGELTVITENKDTIYLKPDDALSEVVEIWHYGINEGDTPVELIIFYAGAEGLKNTTIKGTTDGHSDHH